MRINLQLIYAGIIPVDGIPIVFPTGGYNGVTVVLEHSMVVLSALGAPTPAGTSMFVM